MAIKAGQDEGRALDSSSIHHPGLPTWAAFAGGAAGGAALPRGAGAHVQHGRLGHAGRGLEAHARQRGRALQGRAALALHALQRDVYQRSLAGRCLTLAEPPVIDAVLGGC